MVKRIHFKTSKKLYAIIHEITGELIKYTTKKPKKETSYMIMNENLKKEQIETYENK